MLNRWQRTIVDLRGNVVPYAQLQIRVESTQATATIYADRAGNELIPNGIVTADANGYAYFYAKADLYRISSMQPTIDWRYVDIGSANAVRIATEALDESLVTYPTLAELEADTTRDVNSMGRVVNDGSNNGYYLWDGTDWVRTSYQPMQRDEFDDLVLHVENDFLRKDIEQSAPLLRDIPQIAVVDLPYDVDQLYAQIWAARYPGLPAPAAYFEFGAGARLLYPDLTFSRSTPAWYWKNGVLVEAGINEPVFEDGGLRLAPTITNYATASEEARNLRFTERIARDGVYEFTNTMQTLPDGTQAEVGTLIVTGDLRNDYVGRITQSSNLYYGVNGGVRLHGAMHKASRDLVGGERLLYDITGTYGQGSLFVRDLKAGEWAFKYLTSDEDMGGNRSNLYPYTSGVNLYQGYAGSPVEICMAWPVSFNAPTLNEVIGYATAGMGIPPQTTTAADQFQWTGASFDRAFNPSQGAFIFKIGEKSALPPTGNIYPFYGAALWTETGAINTPSAGGVYFSSTQQGRFRVVEIKAPNESRHNDTIRHNIYPGDTVGLSWQGETISLFVNGSLAGSFTHPDVVGALQAVTRFHVHDAQHMYLERLTMFATRPTDAEMEAFTYA